MLSWITSESSGDHTIEIVTDNMLDQVICSSKARACVLQIVSEYDHVAVVFYDKGDEKSDK